MNSMYLCYLFSERLEADNEQSSGMREQKALFSPHQLSEYNLSYGV